MSGNGALIFAPRIAPPFPPEYLDSGLLLHVISLPSPYGIARSGIVRVLLD
jgi:hypothetical protein